jgi:hypothetical protein
MNGILARTLPVVLCVLAADALLWSEQLASPEFTSITAQVTKIEAAHVNELRTAIATLRSRRGLPSYPWTGGTLTSGVSIRAVHLMELRSAVADVFGSLGQPVPPFIDPAIVPGVTPVRRLHLTEIQDAVKTIWSAVPPPACRFGVSFFSASPTPITAMTVSSTGGVLIAQTNVQPFDCAAPGWRIDAASSFLQLDRMTGLGSQMVTITVPPTALARQGTVTFTSNSGAPFNPGPTVVISQAARCTFTVTPPGAVMRASGGTVYLEVWRTPENCAPSQWTVTASHSFLQLTTSSIDVAVSVAPTSVSRTGMLTFSAQGAFNAPGSTVYIDQVVSAPGPNPSPGPGPPPSPTPGQGRGAIYCGWAVYPPDTANWTQMPYLYLNARLGYDRSFRDGVAQFHNTYSQTIHFNYETYPNGTAVPTSRARKRLAPGEISRWGGLANVNEGGGVCVIVDAIRFGESDSGPYY